VNKDCDGCNQVYVAREYLQQLREAQLTKEHKEVSEEELYHKDSHASRSARLEARNRAREADSKSQQGSQQAGGPHAVQSQSQSSSDAHDGGDDEHDHKHSSDEVQHMASVTAGAAAGGEEDKKEAKRDELLAREAASSRSGPRRSEAKRAERKQRREANRRAASEEKERKGDRDGPDGSYEPGKRHYRPSLEEIATKPAAIDEVPFQLKQEWANLVDMVLKYGEDAKAANDEEAHVDGWAVERALVKAALGRDRNPNEAFIAHYRRRIQWVLDCFCNYRSVFTPMPDPPVAAAPANRGRVHIPRTEQQKNATRCQHYASRGRYGKAARALIPEAMADLSDEKQMKEIREKRTKRDSSQPIPAIPKVEVKQREGKEAKSDEEKKFREAKRYRIEEKEAVSRVKRSKKSLSAAGYSGWNSAHVHASMQKPETRKRWANRLTDLGNGDVPAEAAAYVLTHRGIATIKKNGRLRQIDVGEWDYRIVGSIKFQHVQRAASSLFAPLQMAFGVSGACEVSVHMVQEKLRQRERRILHVAMFLDLENAYATCKTQDMLNRLFDRVELEELWRFAHFAYSGPVNILMLARDGKILEVQISENGARQGCPLGGLLFSLAVHKLYQTVMEEHPNVLGVAYIDDLTIVGPVDEVIAIYRRFKELCPAFGLRLSAEKSVVGWFHDEPIPASVLDIVEDEGLIMERDAVKMLGAPVGFNEKKMSDMVKDRVQKKMPLIEKLKDRELVSATTSLGILRTVVNPILVYSCRTSKKSVVKAACDLLNTKQKEVFAFRHRRAVEAISEKQWAQIQLPIRLGGHGLRNPVDVADQAYVDAQAKAAQWMKKAGLTTSKDTCEGLAVAIHDIRVQLPNEDLKLPSAESFVEHFAQNPQEAKEIQHRVTNLKDEKTRAGLKAEAKRAGDQEGEARLNSVIGAASLWLTSQPWRGERGSSEDEYIFGSELRYGLEEDEGFWFQCGFCGEMTNTRSHAVRCSGNWAEVIGSHDDGTSETYHFLKSLGCVTRLEELKLEADSNKRMDIFLQFGNKRKLIDFQTRHPLTKSNLRAARRSGDGLFELAEAQKKRKYEQMAREQKADLVPFITNTFGGWGKEATKVINEVLDWYKKNSNGVWAPGEIIFSLPRKLALILLRHNYRMVERCIRASDIANHAAMG
jgi:hypothetical protein